MQYWIFYSPGVGGDGFANLLEHAHGMHVVDGSRLRWKIDHRITDVVKFYDSNWSYDGFTPLRKPNLDYSDTVLRETYTNLIDTGLNTVLPTHYVYFDEIDRFPHKNIVEKNQVKINLYSLDFNRVVFDYESKLSGSNYLKNVGSVEKHINHELSRTEYAIHIDIEKVWTSWDYLKECLDQLGIILDKKWYDEYITLIRKNNT